MFRTIQSFLFLFLLPWAAFPHTSPNGRISVDVAGGTDVVISAVRGSARQPVLTIKCGAVKMTGEEKCNHVEYEMITGKRKHCTNEFRNVECVGEQGRVLSLRIYNDGVAWKSASPSSSIDVSEAKHWWLQKWTDAYEHFFPKDVETVPGSRWAYPALFEYGGDLFALLTESCIDRTDAASSLHAGAGRGRFEIRPDGKESGGWQTLVVGRLCDIVESTLVTDNSEACKLADTSWIRPGVASWVYWAYNHGSNDYEIIRKYVDMAVNLSLPYVLIDAEWDEMRDGKTVEDAVEYARACGVRPLIWYNSSVGWVNGAPGPKYRLNTPDDCEKEFAWCERIGVAGVKIDFFSGDTNMNIRFMADLLEAAARHHLLVNFHGATLPRGWQRTYPHLITTEAVYGAEWYNNVPTFTKAAASHNATLPFTRNVVGSMDYTPCAFSESQHPHITTHAHELALTVLFESGIQHIADRPESILSQPAEVQSFFTTLPAAWDDTFLLDGYPGEYVVMARRSGRDWYVAGINGTDRGMDGLPLDCSRMALNGKKFRVVVFADGTMGPDTGWSVRHMDTIPEVISMKGRGGFVIKIQEATL